MMKRKYMEEDEDEKEDMKIMKRVKTEEVE